jgi:hypothetical protein
MVCSVFDRLTGLDLYDEHIKVELLAGIARTIWLAIPASLHSAGCTTGSVHKAHACKFRPGP